MMFSICKQILKSKVLSCTVCVIGVGDDFLNMYFIQTKQIILQTMYLS